MLGKIMKYDFKAQFKSLFPVYMIALGLSIVLRLMNMILDTFPILNSVYGFLFAMTIVSLIGVVVWTAIVAVRHFYTNLLCDEGYLTNTLPLTRNQLILSKEILIIVTMVISAVVIALSIMIAFYYGAIQDFFTMISIAFEAEGVSGTGFFVWIIVIMIVAYISSIQMCFTALMCGQTKNNNKIMFAIVYGIIIYIIRSLMSLGALFFDICIDTAVRDLVINGNGTATLGEVYDYMVVVFATTMVVSIVVVIIQHCVSVIIANRKLNLE